MAAKWGFAVIVTLEPKTGKRSQSRQVRLTAIFITDSAAGASKATQGPRSAIAKTTLSRPHDEKAWRRIMTARFSAVAAITWLLSVAVFVSAAHFDVAQAQSKSKKDKAVALACGQEMKKRCSGVPVLANNMLECLRKEQANLSPRC